MKAADIGLQGWLDGCADAVELMRAATLRERVAKTNEVIFSCEIC